MAELGSIIDGKYEILHEIGRGGMSIVYLAMDTHLNKQWAIKEILKKGKKVEDEVAINSLIDEAHMMKRFDHPSFPRIVDILDKGDTIYVIMDYIEGESLDKILDKYGPQPEDVVIGWAKQICDALGYLHSQKPPIIYRDMKPSNVMVRPEGNIKIIDFGIATRYKEQKAPGELSLGTPGYCPPEQKKGRTDARSDIYALGMTMHQLLTGIDPRSGEPYVPVRQWNPELSEGIEIIIDKCVQTSPGNRYQSCADLLYDLEHPELITRDYRKKQKIKVGLFIASAVVSVMLLISGVVCKQASDYINNNNYDNLVSISASMPLAEKLASYEDAINIYPDRIDAYLKVLEAYEDEGKFSETESRTFLGLYAKGKNEFDRTSVAEAEFNYKAGTMYFNYYTVNDGADVSISSRVQKAIPFFELNHENGNISEEFAEKKLSDCYYEICSFYKDYILESASVDEASKSDYDTLFNTIEGTLADIKEASSYDQLSLYNAVFMLMYDQRIGMMQVNVEQGEVDAMVDFVYERAKSIDVYKDRSKKLQDEILNNYASYRNAIDRAYDNAEGRQ